MSQSIGTAPRTAVIVDDHAIFRSGLRADLDPDVVLLDVHLPGGAGGGGAEVAERVLAHRPEQRFLALSVSDAADDVVAVIRAGARGDVTKTSSGAEVTDAAVRVADGDAVFSPRLAGFVLDAFRGGPRPAAASPSPSDDGAPAAEDLDRLSAREREVMRLIARGYTYREAGDELYISDRTVETHVSSVLRKLQLSNRHELTRWAACRGLA